jgi:hypothetical protein
VSFLFCYTKSREKLLYLCSFAWLKSMGLAEKCGKLKEKLKRPKVIVSQNCPPDGPDAPADL